MEHLKKVLLQVLIISLALICISQAFVKPQISSAETSGYEFSYQYKGQIMTYEITHLSRVNSPGTAKLTKIEENTSKKQLDIPSTVTDSGNTYKVTEIGDNAFESRDYLETINLPNSITKIGEGAFKDLSITTIALPEGLTEVGDYAFSGTFLQTIKLPQSLTTIGKGSFSRCEALTSIVIPKGVSLIDDKTFQNCSNLTTIQLPDSINIIERGAFSNCKKLSQINVPSGLKRIDQSAFPEDSNLLSKFSSVKGVQINYTFDGISDYETGEYRILVSPIANTMGTVSYIRPNGRCTSSTLTIPRTINNNGKSYLVTEISEEAFANTKNITTIKLPNSITRIGDKAFYWSDLKSINIPNGVTQIGAHAFEFSDIDSIIIPNSVTYIGEAAFASSDISKITLSNSMKTLNDYLFYRCSYLTNITMPNSIQTIGRYTFYLSSLFNITIPKSVTKIDDGAFGGCDFLRNITIPDSVTELGPEAFGYCSRLVSAKLPSSLGVVENNLFSSCERLQSAPIPSKVTAIGSSSYSGCALLEGVVLPSSLTKIGNNSFEDCHNLNKLTIPKNTSSIGTSAFKGIKHIFTVYPSSYGETYLKKNKISCQYVGAKPTKVPIDKVVVKQTELVRNVGDKITLSVSISPSNTTDSKKVTWSTSNPFRATVDSKGVVTLKEAGYVTITATAGNKSSACDITINPATPVLKAISNGYNSIKLTWNSTPGISYVIFRSISPNGTFKQIASGYLGDNYIDKNLDHNYTYYYKCYAYTYFSPVISTSDYSKVVSAYPILSKPDKITATPGAKGISISWNKSNGAEGYLVYRATSANGKYTLVKDVKSTSYIDNTVKKGNTYYYKVAAYNYKQKQKIVSAYTKVVNAKAK